jgi:HlyD family secretion protein
MLKKVIRWILVLIIIAVGVLGIRYATRPKPVEVTVQAISRDTVSRTVANTRAGTVKACRRAKLSPSMGGQIAELPIKEGDRVKSGQLLLSLWNEDLAANVVLTRRQVASAEARARSACLKAEVARRSADRLLQLRRSDAVSVEQADNAAVQADASQAECTAAKSEKEVRQAQLAVARANFNRTRLNAPFDGVIAEINADIFEYVTPSPVGVPTPPAVDLIDNTCFYVSAPIDEVDAADIRLGMQALISLDAYGNRHFQGRVRRIADYVLDREKQARTVDVEVTFVQDPEDGQLLAGYSADIEVVIEKHEDVLRIPTEAVIEDSRVYVYEPQSATLQLREISIGIANWDYTEVMDGLGQDEKVVTNVDNPDLFDGAPATLKEATP